MKLSKLKCIPCQGGEPKLLKNDIDKYLKEIKSGWEREINPDKIVKDFEFKDFSSALNFVYRVGEVAEKEGHHPNIYLHDWKYVKIELWTHKIGGLHKNDFILASKIDSL
jgi:4a-hydroxytetrahydrobiopterin dehydratase